MIDPRLFKGMSTSLNAKLNRRSVLRLTAAGAGLVVASRYFTGPVAAQVAAAGRKGHLHGRLRADRQQQPVAAG